MTGRFPGLGSDPAPGDLDQVRLCGRQHARVAVELDGLALEITRAGELSSAWHGEAAAAFAGALAPLPAGLRTAAEAFGSTAARLTAWAGELAELQVEARALERTASAALDRMRSSQGRPTSGATAGASALGAPPTSALLGGGAYVAELAEAQEELRRALWAAHDLKARWRDGGRRAAAAVRAAADAAPAIPLSVGEVVWRHRRTIRTAADVLSLASVPVALLPAAGPPLAAGLGLVSTAGHAALATYADGSLTDVALGAGGVGLAGASIAAVRAARSPVAGAAMHSAARTAQAGDVGYGAAGGGMTVRKHVGDGPAKPPGPGATAPLAPGVTAPVAPGVTAPSRGGARPSPALRQLLVVPVTGTPGETSR